MVDYFITETDDAGRGTGDNWHNSWAKSYTATAQAGADGNWQLTYNGWGIQGWMGVHEAWSYGSSASYYWSNNWAGVALVKNYASGNVATNDLIDITGSIKAVPDVDCYGAAHVVGWWLACVLIEDGSLRHYYAAQSYTPTVNAWGTTGPQRIRVNANTYVKLYTGGKATVARQNLFCISAWANEYYEPGWPDYGWPYLGTRPIDKSRLKVCGKPLGSDGNLWIVLPDNSEQNITVRAPGVKHFDADATPQKYKSYFTAYAEEPNPGGLPIQIYVPGQGFGHCWWNLSCDAPRDEIIKLFPLVNTQGTAYVDFLGDNGYFPVNQDPFLLFTEAPGILIKPGSGQETYHRRRLIGFDKLVDALTFTGNLSAKPKQYNLYTHNCTTVTVDAGNAAGVTLPNEKTPQSFGFHLNGMPMDE